ncbi:serine/threonine protein kinase [Pendulispora brunnea]|uniref:Serine/threonine protein kinase n=1 Tax=Pendulispora brunnea TaxID=2905690 RepID=A0ABZ2K1F5_9BACT
MTVPAEDAPPASEAPSFVGQIISGRYKVLELLGEGGMGAVYLAEHVHMRKRVAIKVLHPDMVGRAEVVARFEREAMAAAHIEHPNVAAATDFGRTDDGAFFLVLEYIEGIDLRTVLRDQGALEVGRALHVARQIASALMRAHELGIVHRDLKPENVMLIDRDEGDFVKVLDFGIAKVHVEALAAADGKGAGTAPGAILTRAGAVFGTPEYMAPEQALGETVDHRADLYALGVMLFEMLSGKLPFEGNDTLSLLAAQIATNAPSLRSVAPERNIPPEVEAVVTRLLEKQPNARYAKAEELVSAIDHLPLAEVARGAVVEPQRSDAGPRIIAPSTSSREIFTPADAMARTSPEVPASSLPSMANRPPTIPVMGTRNPRHIWVAVVVAVCGGALLVGAFTLLTLFRHVKESVLGGGEGGVLSGVVAPPQEKKGISQEEIDSAASKGAEPLEKLASENPKDPRIFRALFRTYFLRGDTPEAMRAIGRLVAVDPNAANDGDMLTAVQVAATDPSPETREAAIDVLEGPLGTKGADILYELANRTPAVPGKARFVASLARPEVMAHASPSLMVLMDLRAAKKCEDKRDLLPRVRDHGDSRILPQLKTLQRTRGCGFLGTRDCYGCLRKDSELLEAAISAVQARP